MEEIVRIGLENEMDLVLAHKRTMKLAELCGLGLPSQTTFATSVSEVARCAITHGEKSHLILGVETKNNLKKELTASIHNIVDLCSTQPEALQYAKRLMGDLPTYSSDGLFEIRLAQQLPFSGKFSKVKIESFREFFRQEPAISPYDEIRRKNLLLVELSTKLQKSEQHYQVLTDTLPLMMFTVNKTGGITYTNKWLRDFFPPMDFANGIGLWQNVVHRDDQAVIWEEWDRSQQIQEPFRAQCRLRDRNQNYLWHLVHIVPSPDASGAVQSWIGFFVDIHQQKLVEQTLQDNKALKAAQSELLQSHLQLEQKIRELHDSNKNLEQFAFIASHDLQEPLRKIKIFSHLLGERLKLDENNQRYFNKILSATDRMSALIRDVLYYSHVSHVENLTEEIDLSQILEDVVSDLEVLINEKKATVIIGNLPALLGVRLQFWQLFSNLITNAIKFCQKPPFITVSSEEVGREERELLRLADSSATYYCIKVQDNGIGFEPRYADKIFTIFQRLHDIESTGTGIGLALCKKIVENHGGLITAESSVDNGATFKIYLPDQYARAGIKAQSMGVHV